MSIDACIKKVTYCHIIYGKTVETANEIANLCLAYQDQGHTDFSLDLDRSNHPLSVCLTLLQDGKYFKQVNKHLKILQEHAKGAPGARLADTTELKIVHTKLHTGIYSKCLKFLAQCVSRISVASAKSL